MDVNGTRFHLFRERSDWRAFNESGSRRGWERVDWDDAHESLILRPKGFRFQPPSGDAPLDPLKRRDAAADEYGTVYWIGTDLRSILRQHRGSREALLYWSDDDERPPEASPAEFGPAEPEAPQATELQGLTVTSRHFLVAGLPRERALLVFDLHAGGPPLRASWPTGVDFTAHDVDAGPFDGLWILDAAARAYWFVDAGFRAARLAGQSTVEVEPGLDGDFAPAGAKPAVVEAREFPRPMELPEATRPISIASGPDGTVLILDTPEGASASRILRYRGSTLLSEHSLADSVLVADESDDTFSVVGYDLLYLPDPRSESRGKVYVVEATGNQAFAFDADWTVPALRSRREYLPIRRNGGTSLVHRGTAVQYESAERWLSLASVGHPRYERDATLHGPILDGREHACLWHRVLLDACIPPGTSVELSVRAADQESDVRGAKWRPQPALYLRGLGPELPYYRPYTDDGGGHKGTWETLLQDVRGRYLQLRLRLLGTEHATPSLHAMRVWYPRFSYLERYLPKLYRDDQRSASLTDRLLANFEGLFTTWEEQVAGAHRLLDPRAAPPESLDWLAGWLGIMLEPVWDERRKRLFIAHAAQLFLWRGTIRGIETALRLYLEDDPTEEIFRRPGGDDSPVRIVERFRIRAGRAGVMGVEDAAPATSGDDEVAANAHRFIVLIPEGLGRQRLASVRRIVELEKPAHTDFDLHLYWALFRVGTARLAVDTELGSSASFRRAILGQAHLGTGEYIAPGHPFDVDSRTVVGRDAYDAAPT